MDETDGMSGEMAREVQVDVEIFDFLSAVLLVRMWEVFFL